MTVKTELERLKKKKADLEKDRSRVQEALEELISQKTALQRKEEELSQRKSPLAQTLQAKNQKELEEIQQRIETERRELQESAEKLQEIQTEIDARENDTTLYIQEQVSLMVPQFLEWVAKNKEAIGYDIKRSFRIAGVVRRDAYGKFYYPIGNMGIFGDEQETNEVPIVCSNDFYFQQSCYEIELAEYDSVNVKQADWYTMYRKDFIQALLEELEESYKLGEELKLTIESPNFTLELV